MWFTIKWSPALIIKMMGRKVKMALKVINLYLPIQYKRNVPVKPLKLLTEPQGSKEHGFNTTDLQWHTFLFVKMLNLVTLAVCIFITIQMTTLSVCIILQTKCTVPSLQFSTFQSLKLAKVAGSHNKLCTNCTAIWETYFAVITDHTGLIKKKHTVLQLYFMIRQKYIWRSNKPSDNEHNY